MGGKRGGEDSLSFFFFFFAEIDIIMCIENDFLVMGIFFKLQN